MEYRRIGNLDIQLSVIGMGTAQLQMLPHKQVIETLLSGFKHGINWVHTAPDYGGVENWIAEAIRKSRKDIKVLTQSPGSVGLLEDFFENTCRLFGKHQLEMYGINCISDLEVSANVWGNGGMIDFLQKKRSEGRLKGIFCSTHGSIDHIKKLIKSNVFDAIMLAYNPLEFHLLTYYSASTNHNFERIGALREEIFPMAEKKGIGLIIMKPLAGGLLCQGKAFPPYKWYPKAEGISATELLRYSLNQPGVCAVVPGTASVSEAKENALAGHTPVVLGKEKMCQIYNKAQNLRHFLCSRCGECENTCSKNLKITSIIRDAYIWNNRSEIFMSPNEDNYFLHNIKDTPICEDCRDMTCKCPQNINIPEYLSIIHKDILNLKNKGCHPGNPEDFKTRIIKGFHNILVVSYETPKTIFAYTNFTMCFLLENCGENIWQSFSYKPDIDAQAIGILFNDKLVEKVPIRYNICPGQRSPVAFEAKAPAKLGKSNLKLRLMPLDDSVEGKYTLFFEDSIDVKRNTNILLHMFRFAKDSLRILLKEIKKFLKAKMRKIKFIFKQIITGNTNIEHSGLTLYGALFTEITFPVECHRSVTYAVCISIENTGSLVWQRNPENKNPVDLFVTIDGSVFSILKLPTDKVEKGQKVTFHFPIRVPVEPGEHIICFDLVEQNVAWFKDKGTNRLIKKVRVVDETLSQTTALFQKTLKYNQWHYLPTQGIETGKDGRYFPLFIDHSKGCYVWDTNGKKYIDYTMSWGATILGHADNRIQKAIKAQLHSGPLPPFPHPLEMEVSEMLCEDFPSGEMVVFGKNGSDVCTVAARMARLNTGKKIILSCGFHGWQDFCLDYFSFESSGIPKEEPHLYKFQFNNKKNFLKLFNKYAHDLAAVMIEPSGPFAGEQIGPEGDIDLDFLHLIADCVKKSGALLIFDEIITGYRYKNFSVQKSTGVIPDLTCLGKALASGMPLSALVGKSSIFHNTFHRTHYCPTFKGEIYSFAAAKASIDIYRTQQVSEHIWKYGEDLKTGIQYLCNKIGISAIVKGPPFRFGLIFKEENIETFRLKKTIYMQELLKEGVITVTGIMLPSFSHDSSVLEKTLSAVQKALLTIKKAEETGDYYSFLDIPVLT